MPVLWKIRCYTSVRGVDEIDAWYQGLSARAKAKFLTRIKMLAQNPRSEWKREPFDLLHDQDGLGEIRFNSDGIQHRALGFFSPGNTFTLVFGAVEKNNKFVPKHTCKIAKSRKKEVELDDQRARPCTFPLE